MKKSDITEMPEYFEKYINLVEDIDVVLALEKYGIEFLKAEFSKFEQLADKIYAPAKWTAKDILQHIIDTERIFCYRALRFARHDHTPLQGCDENMDAMKAKANDRELGDIIEEFKSYDKGLRILTYKILLEKFNSKYSELNERQKYVLKEFINSIDSTPHLREFYNNEIKFIKTKLKESIEKTNDQTIKIKLNEVYKLIGELNKNHVVKTRY